MIMKKSIKYILALAFAAMMAFVSCEDHEVLYQDITTSYDESEYAFIQIFYYVPVTATSSNYVYKIGINDIEYVNNGSSMIATYNAAPSGAVGRYYTVEPGTVNVKLYLSSDMILTYDADVTLEAGYWNVCVYDFDQDPIVFDVGYPFEKPVTTDTDSTSHVRFINFLYEDDDNYYEKPILYQYRYTDSDGNYVDWQNVGDYVGFGETTGWCDLRVNKSVYNSSGYRTIYFRILDENGDVLQKWNSSGVLTNYSDYWTHYIGRWSNHILAGKRVGYPVASERNFYTL